MLSTASRVARVVARAAAEAWRGAAGCVAGAVCTLRFAAFAGVLWMYATLGCGVFGYIEDITACVVLFWILVAPAIAAALVALGAGLRGLGRGLARWCTRAWAETQAKDERPAANATDPTDAPRVPWMSRVQV